MDCRLTRFDRVYLDLDGPLLDCRRRHHRVFCDLLSAGGVSPSLLPVVDTLWERKRAGATTLDLAREACPTTDADSLRRGWLERIEQDAYLELDELQPLVLDTLARLRGDGRTPRLITARRDRESLDRQLANLGIEDFFDTVIVCSPTQGLRSKHEPLGRDVADFDGSACLVGDSEMDMSAAVTWGLVGLGVDCGIRAAQMLLAAGAHEVRPRLASFL
jgi:phosphoglycolate phosphatase-like HAD superfamily hydrolase